MMFPAHSRGGAIHFFLDEKVNKKSPLRLMLWKVVRGLGLSLPHQPRRKKRKRRVCEWTICGGFGIYFFCGIILLSLRGGTTKQSLCYTNNHEIASLRSQWQILHRTSLPTGSYSLFPGWKSKQKITAASDAMKGSAKARVVIAAPAEAEERLGKDCARGFC